MRGLNAYFARWRRFKKIYGSVPRPKPHFSLLLKDHVAGKQLKVELVDLPFSDGRRFRLRVNGEWARKVPVASKTTVLTQVRSWLVKR